MENIVRLNKFIAANGISSRRKVDEMITQGRVTVNGATVIELGHKIDPDTDKVALDGENIRTSTKKIYIILNKPQGVITSVADEKHRTTVIDIINIKEKIFPVGRLDYNTSGLLLLTNDGELANKLMHPKSEVYKTYFVTLSKPLEEKHRLKLEGGIELEGKKTANCKIRFEKKTDYLRLYISIYEGRNRQVRKMFEHYGYFVRDLERIEYAGLKLGGLKPGEWRSLSPEEITKLEDIVKEVPAGSLSNSHYRKENASSKENKFRTAYKKFPKKDFNKYGQKQEGRSTGRDFKKPDSRSEKKEDARGAGKFEKKTDRKETKWGFKSRQTAERDVKLGFKKFDANEDKKFEKKDYKKFDKPGDKKFEKRDYKKFGKSDDKKFEKRDYKKFGKSDDKKFEKRDYKKFEKSDDKKFEKRDYKKFGKSDDKKFEKRDYKKFGKSDDKKFEKRDYKKFDKPGDKKYEKKDFKKFGKRDDSNGGKRDFKKPARKNFNKR